MDKKAFGDRGERFAARWLQGKGYAIVATKVRAGGGEIDVVALDGDCVVIVEVKARSTPGTRPAAAVTRAKIRKVCRAALAFLHGKGWLDREIRFDVVEIVDDGATPHVEHIRDAFLFDASLLYRS